MFIICNKNDERLWQFGPYQFFENAAKALKRAQEDNPRAGYYIAEDGDEDLEHEEQL